MWVRVVCYRYKSGYRDVEGEIDRNAGGGFREICVHMGYGCGVERGI